PHRGGRGDRAVADSRRRGAAARTPAPAQLATGAALAIVGRLPLSVGLWLGRRFGDAAYLAVRRRRQIALANLAVAYPALPRRAGATGEARLAAPRNDAHRARSGYDPSNGRYPRTDPSRRRRLPDDGHAHTWPGAVADGAPRQLGAPGGCASADRLSALYRRPA